MSTNAKATEDTRVTTARSLLEQLPAPGTLTRYGPPETQAQYWLGRCEQALELLLSAWPPEPPPPYGSEADDLDDDGTEPYCLTCREWVGIFLGLEGWHHFRGDPAPGGVRTLYEADHEAVIGWIVPPGRELSPAVLDALEQDAGRLAEIRAVLAAFDWERDDRQYALERIETIATGDDR